MSTYRGRWLEVAVRSPDAGELEVLLSEGLVALGGRAVQERDGWYVTHVPEPADVGEFLARVRASCGELTGTEVELASMWCAHEDWAETWKRGLEPRHLTDRLVVTTTWHPVEERPGQVVLVIDPGMAFGTAEHGTTRGCLRLLDAIVGEGERILDVGAGSGILGIAAARLGAVDVLALEGDPLAVEALAENVELNRAADRVAWRTEWATVESLASLGPRDGVVANIESGILRPLLPGFSAAVKAGGWLILSGILADEWEEMRTDTERNGFRHSVVDQDGEWRSGLFLRRSS
ncbi:MAG TPA: 50S ribosomal protein L11 methyltransferase [Longimicrobiales bacterium]|nr:50S ribosomal protein L11 methyltransferase [Longimicrobiales bacterium]